MNAAFLLNEIKSHHSGKDVANMLQSLTLHWITAASAGEASMNTTRITPKTRTIGPLMKLMNEKTIEIKVLIKDIVKFNMIVLQEHKN